MPSALEFYRTFQSLLTERGIRHALTSGMACVEYGIQQTTKDTDWIIDPAALVVLVALLQELEARRSSPPWQVSYRPLFGAPLTENYLSHGWTSHLAIHDAPESPEHHVDLFGKPPRVATSEALEHSINGIAPRLIVAQMKKTDRDKDWPMVAALSQQAAEMLVLCSICATPMRSLPSGRVFRKASDMDFWPSARSSRSWTNLGMAFDDAWRWSAVFGSRSTNSAIAPISMR